MAAAILNAEEIAAKFSESLRTLAKLQGFSERIVTLAEVGIVLKTCVGRTKVAKPSLIRGRAGISAYRTARRVTYGDKLDNRNKGATPPGTASINLGFKGKYPENTVWYRTKNKKYQPVYKGGFSRGWHIDTVGFFRAKQLMDIYKTELRAELEAGKKATGLARQSWVQMADDIGIILEDIPGSRTSPAAIAKARRAIARDGRPHRNGVGLETYRENKSYVVTLINQLPYWPRIKLDTVLLSVLSGRAKFFEQNVARAIFESHSQTVRAYPWLKLVGASA